jgi:hypothetical protein
VGTKRKGSSKLVLSPKLLISTYMININMIMKGPNIHEFFAYLRYERAHSGYVLMHSPAYAIGACNRSLAVPPVPIVRGNESNNGRFTIR